jgi:GNAT superfamily N-acetyltransferase
MAVAAELDIVPATLDDADFLGEALLLAERSHLDFGLWDYILSPLDDTAAPYPDSAKIAVLADLVRHDDTSPMHWTQFLVLRTSTAAAVGSITSYHYPHVQFGRNPALFARVCATHLQWTADEAQRANDRFGILGPAFSANVDWDDRFVIEGVYVAPAQRGRGAVGRLLDRVLNRACAAGCHQSLVTCSVGNAPARSAYMRAGFVSLGLPAGDARVRAALRIDGYEVLAKTLTPSH